MILSLAGFSRAQAAPETSHTDCKRLNFLRISIENWTRHIINHPVTGLSLKANIKSAQDEIEEIEAKYPHLFI